MREPERPTLYFMRPVGHEGPIKVGYSGNAARRLIQVNKWAPFPLEIVAMVAINYVGRWSQRRYSERIERQFHARYADHRLHHEWFAPNDQLLADIAALNDGTFDFSWVDPVEEALCA